MARHRRSLSSLCCFCPARLWPFDNPVARHLFFGDRKQTLMLANALNLPRLSTSRYMHGFLFTETYIYKCLNVTNVRTIWNGHRYQQSTKRSFQLIARIRTLLERQPLQISFWANYLYIITHICSMGKSYVVVLLPSLSKCTCARGTSRTFCPKWRRPYRLIVPRLTGFSVRAYALVICVIGQNENDVSVSVYACLFKINTFSLVYGCRCGYLCGFVCKKNPIGPGDNSKRRGEPALECNSSVKAAEWAVMLRDHWKIIGH